ncbi:MAG: hypothetical protein GY906_10175 [bacterium]|nr:hypothetical protein [bacterium]
MGLTRHEQEQYAVQKRIAAALEQIASTAWRFGNLPHEEAEGYRPPTDRQLDDLAGQALDAMRDDREVELKADAQISYNENAAVTVYLQNALDALDQLRADPTISNERYLLEQLTTAQRIVWSALYERTGT